MDQQADPVEVVGQCYMPASTECRHTYILYKPRKRF